MWALIAAPFYMINAEAKHNLLHPGHLKIISEAWRQGDLLVIELNSDASVQRNKGSSRPIIPQVQRVEMLLAPLDIDYVHIADEHDPIPFLEKIEPDFHVNGSGIWTHVHRSNNS
jgi:cytidyltransferase-like protein